MDAPVKPHRDPLSGLLKARTRAPGATRSDEAARVSSALHILIAAYALAGFAIAVWMAWRITHNDLLPNMPTTGRWATFDWLTNYQAGFVRRGLLGEALLRLSDATGISVLNLVFAGMVAVYGAFAAAQIALFRSIPDASPALMIIFAPFMLGFEVLMTSATGRKDVIFLAVLAALAFCHVRRKPDEPSRAPEIALCALPALVLIHESFFLYSPYILVFGLLDPATRARRLQLAALWLASGVALGAAVLFHGSAHQAVGICQALGERIKVPNFGSACLGGGAISMLKASLAQGWDHFRHTYGNQTSLTVTPALLLITAAFLPMSGFISQMKENRPQRFLVISIGALCALMMSLPLFIAADDWGRWIRMHAVGLGFILCAELARGQREGWARPGPLATKVLGGSGYMAAVVLYASMWDFNIVGQLIGGGFFGRLLGLGIAA